MADVYDVTGQTQTSILDPGGTVTPAIQVTFTSKPSGVISSVRVPLTSYSAADVDRAIRAMVKTIEDVQAL